MGQKSENPVPHFGYSTLTTVNHAFKNSDSTQQKENAKWDDTQASQLIVESRSKDVVALGAPFADGR